MALSFAAIARTISINAGTAPYNKVAAAQGISADDMGELRIAALTALVGMYRTVNGTGSVGIGDQVSVTYSDGSKEKGSVVCNVGTVCVTPIPGTQQGGGGGGGGGANLPGGCIGNCGIVTVGPP
ncbi:hypothetical protein [Xanthomonas graminis]|uniref:hypothetical protein n=1 Tax=Xanthomonas graminis TaxID=3390026 RepID=UPI0011873AC3|nr:hypothetical protein [Xanthomonas translucens]UKE66800.1 hypothetical protein KM547_05960 [Xanthomonas translucens pv. phlei]